METNFVNVIFKIGISFSFYFFCIFIFYFFWGGVHYETPYDLKIMFPIR